MLPEDWQNRHLRWAENTAGPRYDGVLDVEIDVAKVFAGLCRTQEFRDRLVSLANRLTSSLGHSARDTKHVELERLADIVGRVSDALKAASTVAADGELKLESVVELSRSGSEIAWGIRDKSREKDGSGENRLSDFALHDVNKASDLLAEVVEFCEGREAQAAGGQSVVLTGPAGAGKTHLLLHVAFARASQGLPTAVLFGDMFSGLEGASGLTARLGLDDHVSLEELLDELEAVGVATGTRSLLIIDALNETAPCALWVSGLPWLREAVLGRPHVCTAVSVRDGFEHAVSTSDYLASTFVVRHPGFGQNHWEAVRRFFSHYGVRWPEIPLLGPEFANPLFLKLFSMAFSGETPPTFRGHSGGTHIFEAYAKKVGPAINRELGMPHAPRDKAWKSIVKPLAVWMGEHGVQEIPTEDAVRVADAAFPGGGESALASLENHALIMKVPRYGRDGEIERFAYVFSYQKFSDHLIVRFLLNSHFAPHSDDPERAFDPGTRLGRIANLEEGAGLLEALAAQVPERTNGDHELAEYVPEDVRRSWSMTHAFLDSLVWRKTEALGQAAIDYINDAILGDMRLVDDFFEVVLSVASIPDFRLNARGLHRLLSGWSLPDRDQVWTAWVRYQYADEGTAVDRLVSWSRHAPGRDRVAPEAALLTSVALSWLFVSPNRFLRDDATKAAIALLEHHPAVIPDLLVLFERVDDPYVLERVVCSAFGALARNRNVEALRAASDVLLKGFFTRRDCTHLLTRDYARGIVELAVASGVLSGAQALPARPPYGAEFPDDIPTKDELLARYGDSEGHVSDYGSIWHSVMDWDFGRYIIGTNSGSTPWSSRRLGEPRPLSLDERWEVFRSDLASDAGQAYSKWQDSKAASAMSALLSATGGPTKGSGDNEVPGGPACEENLRSLLTEEQEREFSDLLAADVRRVPDDTFDLRLEQAWVFERCLDLGWTKERFGTTDSQHGWERHDTRKIERIGKKYQWIAHYEFLGLLADNFALRPRWGEDESPEYRGPWVDYCRDIDPTCLADGLMGAEAPSWTASPGYDPDGSIADQAEWLTSTSDLVDPARIIQLQDDDGELWIALEALCEWSSTPPPGIDIYGVLHRRVWYQIRGYLVNAEHVDAFVAWGRQQDFMGRWMPESREFSEIYLREFPESEAFEDLVGESEPERWDWSTEVRGHSLDIPLLVASACYSGSAADRDCSVRESFAIHLPTVHVVRGMGLSQGCMDGAWMLGDRLVALDPSVGKDSPSRVLVRRRDLEAYLSSQRLSVVWTLTASKELSGGWADREDRCRGTSVSGVFSLGEDQVIGEVWTS